ncbi:MAG: DUF1801 domain-containing protein [Sphaerochaetaceae bacterium]|jgi:hypothetical protein|nr:DUF1801 domain-containing protein [Sphaerochaetaceae bacterium]
MKKSMQQDVRTVEEYIMALPEYDREPFVTLRNVIVQNLPEGFEEQLSYTMVGYVVPLSVYPKGYHVKKGEPLPFIAIASQKHYISLYHMGLYADNELLQWFSTAYASQVPTKLDMGKSCIRFRNPKHVPYSLIGELCQKMTVSEYVSLYERSLKRN